MARELTRHLRRNGGAVVHYAFELEWEPDCVVQVGVGAHHQEVDIMRAAWPGTRFVGFEPNSRVVDMIVGTYPGALYRMAISNYNGHGNLHRRARHADGASLCMIDGTTNTDRVEVKTLDSAEASFGPFGRSLLLWLDCEGVELQVLQKAERCLQSVSMINVELTMRTEKRAPDWCSAVAVHEFLNDAGFARTSTHTHRTCIGQADALYVSRELLRERDAAWMVWCPCQLSVIEGRDK